MMQSGPLYKEERPMLSLQNASAVQITRHVETARTQYGCCKCCHAPDSCWCCMLIFPCCKYPKKVSDKLEDSKYVYVRENSVEWNDPTITFEDCDCCIPVNFCSLRVADNVQVLYFDDPAFEKIQNKSCGCITNCMQYMFGGKGQKVRFANMFCGCCVVGKGGAPCVPVCCCPNATNAQLYDVYVKDGASAAAEIKQAKVNAKARMSFA
jgi:hypothetical protein